VHVVLIHTYTLGHHHKVLDFLHLADVIHRSEISNHVREAMTEGLAESNPVRSFAKDLVVSVAEKTT